MRGNLLVGIAIGAGTMLFGPPLWRSGRPAIKKAVRAGMEGYGAARVAAARFVEEVEDLVAEVAHEMHDVVADAQNSGEDPIHSNIHSKKQADG